MAFYKFLYDNGYLKGAKKESSITLKGAQKLSSFFEASFNFISIEIISEDKYFKEFDIFKTISEKFIKNKTDSIVRLMKKMIILQPKKMIYSVN